MSSRNLLKPCQVADQLGYKRRDKVYELIHSGEIRASNISRGVRPRWRIEQEEVDAFVERGMSSVKTVQARRRDTYNYDEVPNYV